MATALVFHLDNAVEFISMNKALDFAHYLLELAGREDEPDCLTHLQIQKLLYYLQGWSLALRDRAAFPEEIEAWTHGPVVREVFGHFSSFKKTPVIDCCTNTAVLSDDERFFAEIVWNAYKKYSPIGLRNKTHAEAPWKNARGDLQPDEYSNAKISQSDLHEFFVGEMEADKECHFVGIPNWSATDDKRLVELAKRAFIKNSALLRRLAQ